MSLLKKTDYYALLQVHPRASDAVIAKAYRELCKIYHPDAGGTFDQMRRLNEAYEVLRDPERRRAYDLQCGRLPWPFAKAPAPAPKAASKRPEVGLPWWDPFDSKRPLAWVRGELLPGRVYPFERPRHPWDKPHDARLGRCVECAVCQSRVLVVFKPDSPRWARDLAGVDAQHCVQCGHHPACYECQHAESRAAFEVRLQVLANCVPLPSFWMAVR